MYDLRRATLTNIWRKGGNLLYRKKERERVGMNMIIIALVQIIKINYSPYDILDNMIGFRAPELCIKAPQCFFVKWIRAGFPSSITLGWGGEGGTNASFIDLSK